MHPNNDLASSAIYEPEGLFEDLLSGDGLPTRMQSRDPWWNPDLLRALREHYNVPEGREILVTNGASGAIWLVAQALVTPGSHVIVEDPVYQPLLAAPKFFNAEISRLERRAEKDYTVARDRLEALVRPDTRLIVLTHLHNPSGFSPGEGTLEWLRDLVKASGGKIRVLVDETFRDLSADGPSPAAILDDCFITISTLSKSYGLSALRCGWVVCSQETSPRIRDAFVMVQGSGSRVTEALAAGVIERLDSHRQRSLAICAANRATLKAYVDPLLEERRIFGAIPPAGCIYFPRVAGMPDTWDFARELWEEWDVCVVPGRFFGAPQHLRIGFGGERERLPEKLERLSAAIRARTFPEEPS